MESEEDIVLKTIFKHSFPEKWRENPDFANYLDELASFSVNKLAKEPERLSDERASILEQTQELAFHNYKTFIQTAECSQEIFQDFNLVEQHLDSLLEKLPDFVSTCENFIKKSQEISSSRRVNTLSLQKHPQLLEILELPQLMDTCVRNGYYEEALELIAYVKRLGKKHSNIPIIMNIVIDVQESNLLMLNQLLNQLRSNIQLPTCLKVIGYLRRMNVFSEAELRIKFLQSRDAWFRNLLSTIPTDDAYHHLSKSIEVSRVNLFDIITQYRAIFSDDDPILASGRENPDLNEASIFHGWIVRKVNDFIDTLENDLKTGDSQGILGRLDSVLGQAMYFGLSFSRVGVDFRGLIAPIFVDVATKGFADCSRNAAKRFSETMESYNLTNLPTMLPSQYHNHSNVERLIPPHSLMEFHPLANFCNKILTGLNDLRLCCPLSSAKTISGFLQQSLLNVVQTMLDFHSTEENAFTDNELKVFAKMCRVVTEDLSPFLSSCLQSLFPSPQLSELFGCTLSQVNEMRLVGKLDKMEIVSRLNPYITMDEDPGMVLKIDDEEESKAIVPAPKDDTQNVEAESSDAENDNHAENLLEKVDDNAEASCVYDENQLALEMIKDDQNVTDGVDCNDDDETIMAANDPILSTQTQNDAVNVTIE